MLIKFLCECNGAVLSYAISGMSVLILHFSITVIEHTEGHIRLIRLCFMPLETTSCARDIHWIQLVDLNGDIAHFPIKQLL